MILRLIKYFVFCITAVLITNNLTFGQSFDKEPHKRISEIPQNLLDSARINPYIYLPILTKELVLNAKDDFEKVKIIHDWITTEISYDNEVYLRRSELMRETNDVLMNKRAICVGYCNLFSDMLSIADIECENIIGVTKSVLENENTLPLKYPGPNHMWNAVRIQGKWYLIDLTWDAGYNSLNPLNKKFTFRYSTMFFLLDPEIFIQNHFPQEKKWQLLDEPVTWSEFRTLKFSEPVSKLILKNKTLKGGINFSRLNTLGIPYLNEAKGFNLSFSLNRSITNELGLEAEFSFDHQNVSQNLSSILPFPDLSSDGNSYIDPVSQEAISIGQFNLDKIGIGLNLKYHLLNETLLLPFLKTGLSVSVPFDLSSSQTGLIAINPEGSKVIRLKNFDFPDQLLYGVLIAAGADLIRKKDKDNAILPVLGIELKWSLLLNSLQLFENYNDQINFKSFSVNLMFYL